MGEVFIKVSLLWATSQAKGPSRSVGAYVLSPSISTVDWAIIFTASQAVVPSRVSSGDVLTVGGLVKATVVVRNGVPAP